MVDLANLCIILGPQRMPLGFYCLFAISFGTRGEPVPAGFLACSLDRQLCPLYSVSNLGFGAALFLPKHLHGSWQTIRIRILRIVRASAHLNLLNVLYSLDSESNSDSLTRRG